MRFPIIFLKKTYILLDLEENGVRLKLTVVEAIGFGDSLNNEDSCRPILENVESRYDHFLEQEFRVNRLKTQDNRIHACLYFISPSGHSLSTLDVECLKRLSARVNIIPVIAKADTLTEEELVGFKQRASFFSFFTSYTPKGFNKKKQILEDIAAHKIQIFTPVTHPSDDVETQKENAEMIASFF
jgi:septin 7